jgi:hypothetical protein
VKYNGGNKYYADTFTKSACLGTGDFAESSSPVITKISKAEGCQKGSQYLNVWMYVIHEMEEAIEDCLESVSPSTHWDESVAFYTGSTTLLNPTTTTGLGVFQYGLAEKKCPLFKTCVLTGDDTLLYKSAVNQKVFALFSQGSNYQKAGQCANLAIVKEAIVKQMTVPLMQGVMQYLYLSKTGGLEKSKAELWSFASSLLPLISKYNPSVAKKLYNNAYIKNVATVPDGHQAVKASLESVYGDIGITCTDVGGWIDSTTSNYASGMEPCVDSSTVSLSSSSTSDSKTNMSASAPIAIALIIIVLLLCLVLVLALGFCFRDKLPKSCNGRDSSPCIPKGDEGSKQLFDTHTNTNQV